MYTDKYLNSKIKNLRLYRGFESQNNTAQFLEINRNRLSEWESGKSQPSTENIVKMANAFDVDMNYFFVQGEPCDFDLNLKPKKKIILVPL